MNRIHIKGTLPGPKTKAYLERDAAVVSPAYTRDYPLVAMRGSGSFIEDPDGNTFLDCTAGIAVTATGHCHPKVVEAIRDQAGRLIHMSGTDFYYDTQIRLAERLVKLVPGPGAKKATFGNSGAEAVEAAFKLARFHTRRPRMIAFQGAFHGRTMGALSLNGSRPVHTEGFHPLIPGVVHVPYADCFRCPFGQKPEACNRECLSYIDKTVFGRLAAPKDVAAIIVEPVQGEGGYVVPPPDFLPGLRKIADQHGILVIADEVQSGMGRTGKMFAIEHFKTHADITAIAKGLGSGMPISATVARADVMKWPPGAHASTFGGNPVAAAASLATIDLLESSVMKNVNAVGAHLKAGLAALMSDFESIGDVRGLGLMIGVDLVTDRTSKGYDVKLRHDVIMEAFRRGLLLLGCGPSTVRFAPPLTLSRSEADTAMAVFAESLRAVLPKVTAAPRKRRR